MVDVARFTKGDHSDLIPALLGCDVSLTTHEPWIKAGMACKASGIPFEAWDEWSAKDTRPGMYPGTEALRKKWDGFTDKPGGVGPGTLARIIGELGGDAPTYGGAGAPKPSTPPQDPCSQLLAATQAIFHPGDLINIETKGRPKGDDPGKYDPYRLGKTLSYEELTERLRAHEGEGDEGLRAVIGPYDEVAGAWWAPNPTDGKGGKNENVAAYRNALIEGDDQPTGTQRRILDELRSLGAPIVAEVLSGNKSVHAIVRVGAKDAREYAERVDALFGLCKSHGLKADTMCKNPSRLSRLPGARRGGNTQRLLGTWQAGPWEPDAWGCGGTHRLRRMLLDGKGHPKIQATDKDLSRLFGEWSRDTLAYVPEAGSYYSYEGDAGFWVRDAQDQLALRRAKEFTDALFEVASGISGDEERGRFRKALSRYDAYRNRVSLLADARECLRVERDRFDADKDLLNVRNGTLDLRTMEMRPHRASDRLTMRAPVTYDPEAGAEGWTAFIEDAQRGDRETIAYIQKLCGLCLISGNPEQKFWLFHGVTRSGKTTALEVLGRMLGPGYSRNVQPETFAEKEHKDSARPTSDTARLAGARFVRTSEASEGMLFGAARLKQLTGGDTMTARFLHENEFEFEPEFVAIMATNHLPHVSDKTLFDSGRLVVVPWMNHKDEKEQDKGLKDKLTEDEALSGLLNWCLEGLARYRAEGLEPSTTTKEATEEYRRTSDKVDLFIKECMERDGSDGIRALEAYEAFRSWCQDSGLITYGKQRFFRELRARGMLTDAARIGGVPVRNVVGGWRLAVDYT